MSEETLEEKRKGAKKLIDGFRDRYFDAYWKATPEVQKEEDDFWVNHARIKGRKGAA